MVMLYGESSQQYATVWDYAETVRIRNEGSSVFIKLTNIEIPPPIFQRMYMCLEGCKAGFLAGCRPILGVDGCHLKGPYPGMLLIANIYSVAWAVVKVENRESWTWFLELLMRDIGVVGKNNTFMSDRQKCLLDAFNTVVPHAEIKYCARHIWANFKLSFPGEAYKQLVWKMARAYSKVVFYRCLGEVKKIYVPPRHWSRHGFSTHCKSAMMLNNGFDSFNNVLRACRDKPVLELF